MHYHPACATLGSRTKDRIRMRSFVIPSTPFTSIYKGRYGSMLALYQLRATLWKPQKAE